MSDFLLRLPAATFWAGATLGFCIFTIIAAVLWVVLWLPIKLITLGSKSW